MQNNLQVITHQEFDKKVEIAFAHLTYMERLKPEEARQKAQQEVSAKFVAQ